MTIYAQEVRPGETAYMDDDGITKMIFIELDNPIQTLPHHDDRELKIILPKYRNEVPLIYSHNLNRNEIEEAFGLLDIALHDDSETMKSKERKIEELETENDRLQDEINRLEAHIALARWGA